MSEGDFMTYEYDFGDDWQHEVVLEKILRVETELPHPVCLGGERRCPRGCWRRPWLPRVLGSNSRPEA